MRSAERVRLMILVSVTLTGVVQLDGAPRVQGATRMWTAAELPGASWVHSAAVSAPDRLPAAVSALLPDARPAAPLELRLQLGATNLVRTARYWLRSIVRHVMWAMKRWTKWASMAALFALVAVAAAVLDRTLIKTWREGGWRALSVSLMLALAVYVRLLTDRNAPLLGKGLLVLAILYGVAPRDLLPDATAPIGYLDDVVAVTLASRCFMRLCPNRLVEWHAVRAARAWNRARARGRSFPSAQPEQMPPSDAAMHTKPAAAGSDSHSS